MTKTYYSDGNTADYSKDFPKGTLEGAQGTIPGADASRGVQGPRSAAGTSRPRARSSTDYAYAAESYDATILAALAAIKGGDTDSRDRPEELRRGLGCH